ncbi:OmpA family protein [Winogradskyella sp. PC D3.3]
MMTIIKIGKSSIKHLLALLMLSISIFAQGQSKLKKADEAFVSKSYMEAAKIYERVAEKGYKSEELLQKLGDSYYFNGKYEEASQWYGELFTMNSSQPSEYLLRYAQSLKATGEDSKGETYFDRYILESGLDNETHGAQVSVTRYKKMIEANSGRYDLWYVPFNTEGIDYGVSFKEEGQLVFASTRNKGVLRNRLSSWDGLPFLDLYSVEVANDTVFGTPKALKGDVNAKYHESTACFTKDGKTMYFTRTNPQPSEEEGVDLYHLEVYTATYDDGKWKSVESLSINGEGFNTAHPVLSLDETRLYFASDRPGGYGAVDLYYVELDEGELGAIVNLGSAINTSGRESFPFVSSENEFYFSSDGHFGLGGYDVFYHKMNSEGEFVGNLLNVGEPINSSFDDVCYIVKNKRGFISSNRTIEGEEVYDNIYTFLEKTPIKDIYLKSLLHGVVTDKSTQLPLPGAKVEVLDVENHVIATLITDEQGRYSEEVAYEPSYVLKVTKENYSSADGYSEKEQEDREHNFELSPVENVIEPGTDLAKVLNIPIIYFDFDKSNIRPDAEVELQKLVEALNMYPELKIDIRSHTDSRGSDRYNEALSSRRAASTMRYLISEGISKDRLTSKGYGEYQLVNHCSNGVPCSKAEHQANRRSEFIVVE